jgi:hypothetical protein
VIPAAAGADGHALAAQYEALRQDVVAQEGSTQAARGLALLMRKGMAVWIKGIEELPRPATADAPPAAPAAQLPHGIERDLIDILTAMALATATATATAGGVT